MRCRPPSEDGIGVELTRERLMLDESKSKDEMTVADPMECAGEWYAIHTRARHEKTVANQLAEKNIVTFLPTVRETHSWSDRKKVVETPLFSCYVFVQSLEWKGAHMKVLSTPGVLRWVGNHGEPAVIPEDEINTVRNLIQSGVGAAAHPFLKVGQRVRVSSGSLAGVEGVLIKSDTGKRLVVSIDTIQRSMSVVLDGYDVIPI
jgi:transcription antitermination factor NusG